MSRDVLARALEAYRVESEEPEKRPAETLRRILTVRRERRRVRPLAWVAVLACSAAAVASIRVLPRLPWRLRIVSAEQARPVAQAPVLSAVPVVNPSIELDAPRVLSPIPPVPAVSSPSPANRPQAKARLSAVAAVEPSPEPETASEPASFDPEDVMFEQVRKAHDVVPTEDDLSGWDRYLSSYPDGRFAPEARYRRALALARLGRSTEALSAFLWFTEGEQGGARREDALHWIRALSQER